MTTPKLIDLIHDVDPSVQYIQFLCPVLDIELTSTEDQCALIQTNSF